MKRRDLVRRCAVAVTAYLATGGGVLMVPRPARAAGPGRAFSATSEADVVTSLFGDTPAETSDAGSWRPPPSPPLKPCLSA